MKNSFVKECLTRIIRENKLLFVFLAITVIGVVSTSLIPPQILRQIIDNNLTTKNGKGLLSLAVLYLP